jgi:hypothetical protein
VSWRSFSACSLLGQDIPACGVLFTKGRVLSVGTHSTASWSCHVACQCIFAFLLPDHLATQWLRPRSLQLVSCAIRVAAGSRSGGQCDAREDDDVPLSDRLPDIYIPQEWKAHPVMVQPRQADSIAFVSRDRRKLRLNRDSRAVRQQDGSAAAGRCAHVALHRRVLGLAAKQPPRHTRPSRFTLPYKTSDTTAGAADASTTPLYVVVGCSRAASFDKTAL